MLEGVLPGGFGERLLGLRGFTLLAPLPVSELALVARLSREREVDAGEILAIEGQPVETVQLIISGRATLSRAGVPVESVGALETIGLLPLAAGLSHARTAIAVDPIHVLEIDAELVADVLDDDFALFARILRLGAAGALSASRRSRALDPALGTGEPTVLAAGLARRSEAPPVTQAPLDAAERLLAMRGTRLLRQAPVDGLAALAKRLQLVPLAPGAEIRTRERAGDLLWLVAGRAHVTVESGAASHPLVIDPDSDAAGLGLLEALADASPALHLRAMSPAQLLRGTVSDLFDVLEDHHTMGRRLLAAILQSN